MPKLENAEIWEGSAKFVKKLETVQRTAAKKYSGAQKRTSIIVL